MYRKNLDKHMETSTPQHMTMLAHAESHVMLQAEHTALQAEHAALQNKLKAMESVLSDHHTTLMNSCTLTTGKSLKVAVSDKPGNHHIILSQELPKPDHKFKLEWEPYASRGEKKASSYTVSQKLTTPKCHMKRNSISSKYVAAKQMERNHENTSLHTYT